MRLANTCNLLGSPNGSLAYQSPLDEIFLLSSRVSAMMRTTSWGYVFGDEKWLKSMPRTNSPTA
jgi:hypothetical protein